MVKSFIKKYFIVLIAFTLLISSCSQIKKPVELFIPDKAIGAFHINFTKADFFNTKLIPQSLYETLYQPLINEINKIGIDPRNLIETYGFIMPYQETVQKAPSAVIIKLDEYDPVIFNRYTLRNKNIKKIKYKDITYFYDHKNNMAIYSKSKKEIYIANDTLSMDELIELSFKDYKKLKMNALAKFLDSNKDKSIAFKLYIPKNLSKEQHFLGKIKATDCILGFGPNLYIKLNIYTSDDDFADAIASIINGLINTTYGFSKLLPLLPEEFPEISTDIEEYYTPETKDILTTFSKFLHGIDIKSKNGNISFEINTDLLLLKKIIEIWPDLNKYLE